MPDKKLLIFNVDQLSSHLNSFIIFRTDIFREYQTEFINNFFIQ